MSTNYIIYPVVEIYSKQKSYKRKYYLKVFKKEHSGHCSFILLPLTQESGMSEQVPPELGAEQDPVFFPEKSPFIIVT